MRDLTIQRTRSFVGSLGRFKVYIEDREFGDLRIGDVPCRLLGVLKNGETRTFSIGENPAKLFVIAGKMSRNFCNDMIEIPAGFEALTYVGQSRFSLFAGNAFRFDGEQSAETLENRKRGPRKGAVVFLTAVIVGLICGIFAGYMIGAAIRSSRSGSEPKVPVSKTFSADGMSVTLTDAFRSKDMEGFNACYDSSNMAVLVFKEPFSAMSGLEDYTLEQYGNATIALAGTDSELQADNGLTYFEYSFRNPENGVTYHYFTVVYKSGDAFWRFQFCTKENDFAGLRSRVIQYAKSVHFR